MHPNPLPAQRQSEILCVISAAALVAAASVAALQMPSGAAALTGLLMLLRISWLEDNIVHDLVDRDDMPPGYVNTARWRQRLLFVMFGRQPQRDPATLSPALLATQMRAEVQGWWAVLLTGAAVLLALHAPAGLIASALAALCLFLLGLRRADELARALRHVETGQPLDRASLVRRPAWMLMSRQNGPR